MIEDNLTVGGGPGVALQARGAQFQGASEGIDGVVSTLSPSAAVGEADGRGALGRGVHQTMVADALNQSPDAGDIRVAGAQIDLRSGR